MAKAKRGRLSSIDLLPEEAMPHVRKALQHLTENKLTQNQIREELNNHLLSIEGCKPIGKSSFNRKALQVAAYGERLIQARQIAEVMTQKIDEQDGDVGALTNETIKTLVYDVIMDQALDEKSPSIEVLKEASLTLMRLERARKTSVEARSKHMREFIDKTEEAVTDIGKAGGLSPEVIAILRSDFLGVVKKLDD